jgi:hypothetical protein
VTSSLTVAASRVIAVVDSTYTYASVAALLDNTGAFKYLSDQAIFADSKTYTFSKSLSDSFGQQEVVSIGFSTSASDSVSFTDSARRSVAKAATDSFGATDALSFISQRNLQTNEVGVITDTASKDFSKSLIHNIRFVLDSATLSIGKALLDDFGMSDSIVLQRVYIREFDEYLTIEDSLSFTFGGNEFNDNNNAVDSYLLSYSKILSDGVAMNDAFGAGDGIAYTFVTSVANIASVSEALAKSSQTTKSETLVASDSGIIVQQDYVDLTYFAEDYVGVSYTF